MPINQLGKPTAFANLRGRAFLRFRVEALKRFDMSDASNAFWQCACECSRTFEASTREIVAGSRIACDKCVDEDDFFAEEILIVSQENDRIPLGEEVIFKGNHTTEFDWIRVEYAGRIVPFNRELVEATGVCF